jgi:DNA-directed RNA polymerase specialized sigma24 family protein
VEGARFEVHFEKARGLHGEAVEPFEACLTADISGRLLWTMKSLEAATEQKIQLLADEGLPQTAIARELGVNQSTVSRVLKRSKEGVMR